MEKASGRLCSCRGMLKSIQHLESVNPIETGSTNSVAVHQKNAAELEILQIPSSSALFPFVSPESSSSGGYAPHLSSLIPWSFAHLTVPPPGCASWKRPSLQNSQTHFHSPFHWIRCKDVAYFLLQSSNPMKRLNQQRHNPSTKCCLWCQSKHVLESFIFFP